MRRLGSTLLALGLLAGCGGSDLPPSSESPAQQQAPLTATDVDVAPECQGILTFLNTSSFEMLDAYLPSDAAANLVAQRDISPFTSLAQVSSVRLIGATRLAEIEYGARMQAFINSSCVGIRDELAVSADDEAAIVSLVNSISSTELHEVLPDAWTGAVNLLNLRPFTSTKDIANTSGIGTVSFRNIRNAATLSKPFEDLASAVNAAQTYDYSSTLYRHFDWWTTLWNSQGSYQQAQMECFGIDPADVPQGATFRSNLADATEVHNRVESSVNVANRNGAISSSVIASGMANLDSHLTGRSFKGCYVSFANDPWSGHNLAFFVDTENGFGVMTDTYWSE